MKKFIRTLHNLSERAAEIQEAIRNVPPKMAGIREALTMTTGQLRELQAEVESNLANLKADNHDRLVAALHEINGSTEVFRDAGYELGQVEMQLSPVPRLTVHLNRVEDVQDARLRSLVSANQERKITHALLTSLIQAEGMADRVDISGQVYYKLMVHIGPIPTVRLCWMPEDQGGRTAAPAVAQPSGRAAGVTESILSSYGKDSFFEPRSVSQSNSKAAAAAGSEPAPAPAPAATTTTKTAAGDATESTGVLPAQTESKFYRSGGEDWGQRSLERFKKMPSMSKYRR